MTRNKLYGATWIALLLLVGCASIGLPAPQTFNDKVAAAYVSVSTLAETGLLLGQVGIISPDDAQNIHDQVAALKSAVDVAQTLYASQPQAASDRLTATLTALRALDAYLKTRGTP